jgi:hypothetical protein
MSATTDSIRQMLAGALAMGYLVAMLFFFRFWRDTRDRLFLLFGIAFLIFAGQRAALAFGPESLEDQTPLFLRTHPRRHRGPQPATRLGRTVGLTPRPALPIFPPSLRSARP